MNAFICFASCQKKTPNWYLSAWGFTFSPSYRLGFGRSSDLWIFLRPAPSHAVSSIQALRHSGSLRDFVHIHSGGSMPESHRLPFQAWGRPPNAHLLGLSCKTSLENLSSDNTDKFLHRQMDVRYLRFKYELGWRIERTSGHSSAICIDKPSYIGW